MISGNKVTGYNRAYERHGRGFMEDNLRPDFTFTRPFADHIDLAAWWGGFWPSEPMHQKFDFMSVAQDGEKVFGAYECTLYFHNVTHSDVHFHNAELLTFLDGTLKSVEVLFGDPPRGLSRHRASHTMA